MVCITSSSMLCPITSLPCEKNIKCLLHFQAWPWQRESVKTPIPDASQGHLGTNAHQTSPFPLCLPHTLSEQPLLSPQLPPIYHRLPQQLHMLRRCTRTAAYNLVSKCNLFKIEVKAFLSSLPFNLFMQKYTIYSLWL